MILAAYLFGSAPYGVLVGALHGVDITAAGSKNIGATNVGRLLGRKWGLLVFFLDMLKGLLPTFFAALVCSDFVDAGELRITGARLACLGVGVAAILGHNYSILLRFKGGRGVATTLGVCLGLYPDLTVPALLAFAVWMVVVAASRYVSLGSICASFIFPVFVVAWSMVRGHRVLADDWPLVAFGLLVAFLGVYRHRANIQRLRSGTEHRIGANRADPAPPTSRAES
jgi:glycerol-3-phosphate acyltransferase PlsY